MTAQPYHAEAKEWLSNRLNGRRVIIKPLRRDHYGRMVRTQRNVRRNPV